MTVIEDDVDPVRNSLLSLSKRNITDKKHHQLKRKRSEQPRATKKVYDQNMLNGYRSNDHHRCAGDTLNECPIATLSNTGNTCYLNSVLYTLRFAPTFLHNLHHLVDDLSKLNNKISQNKAKSSSLGRNVETLSGPSSRSTSSKDLSLGNVDNVPKSKVQIVTEKLHELFMKLHDLEDMRKKDVIDSFQPLAFLQAVREANYIFEGNQQQDAHELLVYLLDNLRDTCDLLAQQVHNFPDLLVDNDEESALPNNAKLWPVIKSWKKSNKKKEKNVIEEESIETCSTDTEDGNLVENGVHNGRKKPGYNFVAEDFEGITLRRTKCLECECITERKEPFYDIPVPINYIHENDSSIDPSEIYRKACATSEKLCDTNKYLCEKCIRYNEASREVSFEKLPNIMVLQLKRFTTTSAGVQKVSSYMPTPLRLACFCESCCRVNVSPLHRYELCCVIMHLGGAMASGHYIAYVRASNQLDDYNDCARDFPKSTTNNSDKPLNFFKLFKKQINNPVIDYKNNSLSKNSPPVIACKSKNCCGVKLNKNVIENTINYSRVNGQDGWHSPTHVVDEMWLECDDESVRPITSQTLIEVLGYKEESTSTPYLLFYSKITESTNPDQ